MTKLLRKGLCAVLAAVMVFSIQIPLTADTGNKTEYADTIFGTSKVYDYEVSSKSGKNYFSFGQTDYKKGNEHNAWRKQDDYLIKEGLVEDTLDSTGNVILSDKRKVPDVKNGKLFQDTELVGNYKFPFVHIGNGIYEYDSAKNNAVINKKTGVLDLTDPLYLNNGYTTANFMPLGGDNFYFGVTTELPFVITENKTANGRDMTFEFSGDDDVWVFVDGKLALDLGGIHNAVKGEINFTKGTSVTTGTKTKTQKLSDLGIDTSAGEHTLKVFYLERGAGSANCKMRFNLVQPTNYLVKYYDTTLDESNCFDSVLVSSHSDGSKLYAGDTIFVKDIKVDEKLDKLENSNLYYGGFVVDDNAMKMENPNAVAVIVTDDDTDVVKVLYIRKPGYKVTYWKADNESAQWEKIDHIVVTDGMKLGDSITESMIDVNLKKPAAGYGDGQIKTQSNNGILGIISSDEPINIDVVYYADAPSPTPDVDINGGRPDITGELENEYAYIYGYTDTIMGAENPVLRSEGSAMLHRLLKQNGKLDGYTKPATPHFADLTGSEWYYTALEFMNYIGVYDGQNEFIYPNAPLTRGEAAKLFTYTLGLDKAGNIRTFDDLDASHPYYHYLNAMVSAGYMEGDAEAETIRPDDLISRAEYVKIYNKVIHRDSRYDITSTIDGQEVVCQFTDMLPNKWYYKDMMRATNSFTDFKVDYSKRQDRNELDEFNQ